MLQKSLGIGLVAIQLFDLIIHAATNQLEPLRIASNGVILTWVIFVLIKSNLGQNKQVGYGALGIYGLLNVLFLAIFGITNPEQADALRVMLFILVGLTAGLSVWLLSRINFEAD